jgi:hypothetical protein
MLFFKECKKILFSLTFILYVIAMFAMFFTQFYNDCNVQLSKPQSGLNDYGIAEKEVPEILMPAATESLVREYLSDSFIAYPIGFYKEVKLSEKKKQKMAEIITEITGITKEQLDDDENEITEVNISENITYEHFRELMRKADKIIGGGSKYGDEFIVEEFSCVSKTYEDALEEYDNFLIEDKITGAYARLYCDYMGIIATILPVFAAVSLAGLDKKSRMEQLVYSRRISSARLIFTRYFALITTMLIPIILTAVIAQITVKNLYPDNAVDGSAIFKYAAVWLIPNIMTSAAVGMFITELYSGLLAIFVQGVWWFGSVMSSSGDLTGHIGKFTLVMRHNSLYDLDLFKAEYGNFVFNRIFFAVISIIAIALTALIYEQKRRGGFNGIAIRIKNPERKSEA